MKKFIAIALLAAFSAVSALPIHAADTPPAPGDKKDAKAARPLPFHGKLDSVDKTAKSVKLADGRTFKVTATTKITKDGTKPGTLDDAKVGEDIGGSYREVDGGKLELVSLRLGAKPANKPKDEKKN